MIPVVIINDTETLSMTDGWQTYTLHLNASDGVHGGRSPSRVLFDMGSDVGQVDIDNVSVVDVGVDTGVDGGSDGP